MRKISILLPKARLESVGISLEDFFRQVLIAHKRSLEDNLYYPLYPLSREDETGPFMVSDSTEVARLTEHNLSRFAILPQERLMLKLYRRMLYDMKRPTYPSTFKQKSFFEYYLETHGLHLLNQAIDVLFWHLIRGTSRLVSAEDGLKALRNVFGAFGTDEGSRGNQKVEVKERTYVETMTFEYTIAFSTLPYPTDHDYLVMAEEEAPVEGRNCFLVSFEESPPRARLKVHLPLDEADVVSSSETEALTLKSDLFRVFNERFNRASLWVDEKAFGETRENIK